MQGFVKKEASSHYVQLSNGDMIIKVPQATETSVSRKITKGKNAGKVIHEEHYNQFTGMITAIKKESKTVDWQNDPFVSLNLSLDNDGHTYIFTMPYSSSYATSFLVRVENMDLTHPVTIESYWVEGDDGKFRGYLGFIQAGQKVERLYNHKDGVYPDVEYHEIKGKTYADDSKRLEFFDAILERIGDWTQHSVSNEVMQQATAPDLIRDENEMTPEQEADYNARVGHATKKF